MLSLNLANLFKGHWVNLSVTFEEIYEGSLPSFPLLGVHDGCCSWNEPLHTKNNIRIKNCTCHVEIHGKIRPLSSINDEDKHNSTSHNDADETDHPIAMKTPGGDT